MIVDLRTLWRPRIFIALTIVFSVYFYATIDVDLLPLQLNRIFFRDSRAQLWDWKDTSEEQFCRRAHDLGREKAPIPNVVHFVMLSNPGEQFELAFSHFLSIKATVLRMNASQVKVHAFDLDTSSIWWKDIQDHVVLTTLDRNDTAQLAPPGYQMSDLGLAHQSDLIRMDILAREGGIYLDYDVFVLKSYADLLSNPRDIVMGHEGGNRYGLCSAVIVARPGSKFIQLWKESYSTFHEWQWADHSVLKPKKLQVKHPDLICPLSPSVFFWPLMQRQNVQYMHEPITKNEAAALQANMTAFGGSMYENQLSYHSWLGGEYLKKLTPEVIRNSDTRFNILMRDVAAMPLL